MMSHVPEYAYKYIPFFSLRLFCHFSHFTEIPGIVFIAQAQRAA